MPAKLQQSLRMAKALWLNRKLAANHLEMKLARSRLVSSPRILQVETTNRCNLNCVMCARPYYDRDSNVQGDMSEETFLKLLPLAKKADRILLFGYGEPLLAPNFWHFLGICSGLGARTSITTNGTLLSRKACQGLVRGRLDALTVSLDAATETTFRSIRGCSLRSIVRNLEELKRVKNELGSRTPSLSVSFVLMKQNLRELPDVVDLVAELGGESLGVGQVKLYTRALGDEAVDLDDPGVAAVLQEAWHRALQSGVRLSLPGKGPETRLCSQPFRMLFVNWDGKVRPCCSAGFVSDTYNLVVGDLSVERPGEIWNNEQMQGVRKGLLGRDALPAPCTTCAFRVTEGKAYERFLD